MSRKFWTGLAVFLLLSAPLLALAQSCDEAGTALCNPLRWGGDIRSFITGLMGWIGSIIGTLAIVMIVFSGFLMIVSQGDPEAVKRAKSSLTYSIAGFVISIFAFIIVAVTQSLIGASAPGTGGSGISNPLGTTDAISFVSRIMRNVLGVVGTLSVLMVIVSGLRYLTARGNDEQVKKARAGLTWAVLGLISVLMAYVIISAVASFFGN